jgi:DNA primase large subunit
MAIQDMQQNEIMSHLLAALDRGEDIGHYGRLVFAMVARHFLAVDELVSRLAKNPGFDEVQARALVKQVEGRDYNPPRRETIMQFQREQAFPICPTNDPDGCNVYKNLRFPEGVYEKINQYYEQKAS